jgi:hypothetical protein
VTESLDVIGPGFESPERVFSKLMSYSVPFFYVDPKLGWIDGSDAVVPALERILSAMAIGAADSTRPTIAIAAPDASVARILARDPSAPKINTDHTDLGWILEWTEVGEPHGILDACVREPMAFSFDLLRINGSKRWPWIDPFIKNLPGHSEQHIARLSQPLIFWTANAPEHFAGVLRCATDAERMARPTEEGTIGIMTDHPHRLAAWLADPRQRSAA